MQYCRQYRSHTKTEDLDQSVRRGTGYPGMHTGYGNQAPQQQFRASQSESQPSAPLLRWVDSATARSGVRIQIEVTYASVHVGVYKRGGTLFVPDHQMKCECQMDLGASGFAIHVGVLAYANGPA
eukprot:2863046-Rhodomonas_salina.2